jgi:hypothetical protein
MEGCGLNDLRFTILAFRLVEHELLLVVLMLATIIESSSFASVFYEAGFCGLKAPESSSNSSHYIVSAASSSIILSLLIKSLADFDLQQAT